jgi:hypothetical protein
LVSLPPRTIEPYIACWATTVFCTMVARATSLLDAYFVKPPNTSFMTKEVSSQAWFKHGKPKPASSVRSNEK